MEITCPACSARYRVADAEIPASGRTLRCSACGAEWAFRPPAAEAQRSPPDPDPQRERAAVATAAAPALQRGAARRSDAPDEPRRSGGFMTGFVLVLFCLAVAAAVYVKHDWAARMLPGFAPQIERYVALVDQARVEVDALAEEALRRIGALTGGAEG